MTDPGSTSNRPQNAEIGALAKWSSECPCGRVHGQRSPSRMKPACPTCDTIHAASDVVALGKFDPEGSRGYVPRVGGCGCVYRTRAEAEAAICAERAAAR